MERRAPRAIPAVICGLRQRILVRSISAAAAQAERSIFSTRTSTFPLLVIHAAFRR
jgi:hypothetical protein